MKIGKFRHKFDACTQMVIVLIRHNYFRKNDVESVLNWIEIKVNDREE